MQLEVLRHSQSAAAPDRASGDLDPRCPLRPQSQAGVKLSELAHPQSSPPLQVEVTTVLFT